MNQWEQLLNLQLLHHHVQQSHLLSQSTIPFCLPHLSGYQLPGVNAPGVPRPFTPIGTIDGSWHFAVVGGGGASLKNHPQVSNPGYQFVCPYPFFPEITDYKSRIMKLEAEIPPVKQAVEDPIAHVAGSAVSRKASNRGRPKKLAASVDAPPSLDKPHLQAQARKSEPCKVQPEVREQVFEEVVLNKVENKEEEQ
ncbi:hypothetical protein NC652_018426 [Populus alba x Populus x berolinensis]|nr:hypothetical protein NC652_018426 [Populus alba x Populus x berolinensis]